MQRLRASSLDTYRTLAFSDITLLSSLSPTPFFFFFLFSSLLKLWALEAVAAMCLFVVFLYRVPRNTFVAVRETSFYGMPRFSEMCCRERPIFSRAPCGLQERHSVSETGIGAWKVRTPRA
jgi:Ca2+/Na+ antiporter